MRSNGLLPIALTLIAPALIAWVPDTDAQDLSRYHEFRLGTDLRTVAQQPGIQPDARLISYSRRSIP